MMRELILERQKDHNRAVAVLVTSASDNGGSLAERHRAFGALVVRFQDMAFGCAFGLLGDYGRAEDAAQEAFLIAYQRLGQLRDPAAFPGWLQQIVRSQCHRVLRRPDFAAVVAWDERFVDAANTANPADGTDGDPERAALRNLERRQVRAALAHLPETERLVTILFYVREYSRAEVAQFLGISAVAVKKRLASARVRLKERLIDMVQEDLQAQRPSNDAAFTTRLMMFTRLFGAFLGAGKSLVQTMTDLSAAEDDPLFRDVIDDVSREIQSGNSMSSAMAKHPAYFDGIYLIVIRRGELFQMVDIVLQRLASGVYFESPAWPFTDAAKRAVVYGLQEVRRRDCNFSGWPHLLLGLLSDTDSGATQLLNHSGVDIVSLRATITARLDAETSNRSFSTHAPEIAALEAQMDDDARRLGRERIDTVVLLVALVETIAASESPFLQSAGIAPERLREHALASFTDEA